MPSLRETLMALFEALVLFGFLAVWILWMAGLTGELPLWEVK